VTFHLRSRHLVAYDALAIVAAYALAFMIRFDTGYVWNELQRYWVFVAPLVLVTIPALYRLGLYRRVWRYASTPEMVGLVSAASLGTVALGLVLIAALGPLGIELAHGFPRGVIAIDWLLTIALIGGGRFLVRVFSEAQAARRRETEERPLAGAQTRTLVVGAGDAGAMVVRELRLSPKLGLVPVGFVDDDARKHGLHIHGVPVLGPRAGLPELIRAHDVQQVVIAMPAAGGRVIREIATACRACGVASKTVPGLYELIAGTASLRQFRDVTISDLLRREPVELPTEKADALVRGHRVLVTGAGGSIGAELCRQLAALGPACLILLGHGEFSLFQIERELAAAYPEVPLETVVADVKDHARVDAAFARCQPEVVFHAAAHKHVSLMERNPAEAVATNVFGTLNVAQAAAHCGAERFVLISTDKAVRPPNVYGATKRLAEMVVQSMAQRHPDLVFATVRFGNVLGSRGSVVPIFQQQIAAGGPITITDPAVTRYFMTIPEAVQLVLQSAALARGGELFVLEMGDPVRIADLARDLVELSGLELGRDIELKVVGLTSGEKLHEELVAPTEAAAPTEVPKVQVLRRPAVDELHLRRHLAALDALVHTACDDGVVRRALNAAVPDAALLNPHRPVPEPVAIGESRA
jgi:FlaA1/EpsC-like NDP-sugar epimerase